MTSQGWRPDDSWQEIDSTTVDAPGQVDPHPDPYAMEPVQPGAQRPQRTAAGAVDFSAAERVRQRKAQRAKTVVRLPAYEAVAYDPVLYAHASRTLHLESNPGNARALVQAHGERDVWINPPPIPLTTPEMDYVYDLHYARQPHPSWQCPFSGLGHDPFSVNIMRGCFGAIPSARSPSTKAALFKAVQKNRFAEIEHIRDKTPGLLPVISPTWAGRPPICTGWPAKTAILKLPVAACPACIRAFAKTSTPTTVI